MPNSRYMYPYSRYISLRVTPRDVDLKVKVYMCLGRRPIPKGAKNTRSTSQEVRKVTLGPSATEADTMADTHTFASLRSLQPRVLPFLLS